MTRPPRAVRPSGMELGAYPATRPAGIVPKRVADLSLKDISNVQRNSQDAKARTDISAKSTPKNHFLLSSRNSDMRFLSRYEPKGIDKTREDHK